jgi:hypothetical protein
MKNITEHKQFYWPTLDDFRPNFPRNTVCIRLWDMTSNNNSHIQISVYGPEVGLSIRKYCSVTNEKDKQKVLDDYHKVINNLPNPITIEWLLKHGFEYD